MITQINGREAVWPEAVARRFAEIMGDDLAIVTQANYFTPQPYVDEWNRGRASHGFVYTLRGRDVCFINFRGPVLIEGSIR
jgi:hypothetical protein